MRQKNSWALVRSDMSAASMLARARDAIEEAVKEAGDCAADRCHARAQSPLSSRPLSVEMVALTMTMGRRTSKERCSGAAAIFLCVHAQ